MLEATIGLNDVSDKDDVDAEAGAEEGSEEETFTRNDLHFLRSLRISVEGEEEDGATPAGRQLDRQVCQCERLPIAPRNWIERGFRLDSQPVRAYCCHGHATHR